MSRTIAVIDYGMGNLRSVSKALEHVAPAGVDVVVTNDARAVAGAERVVFPGQGAIRDCMAEIARRDLGPVVLDAIATKPFLGVCMGLQALLETSEEHAASRGLGVFPGTVRRFPADARDERTGERLKVPHMGWNNVAQARPHPLWAGIDDGTPFYFVHSYFVAPRDEGLVAGRARYAVDFACALARDNVFAVQFHPEKSAAAGLRLLENFIAWDGAAP